jgi:hypothetical protein
MRRIGPVILLLAVPLVVAAGEQPVSPAEAAKQVGKKLTVEMEVKSVGKGKGVFFLNSEKDFKDEKNFTLFIDKDGAKKFEEAKLDPTSYSGKTVRASGEVKLFRERPEIVITDPKQIRLSTRKKPLPRRLEHFRRSAYLSRHCQEIVRAGQGGYAPCEKRISCCGCSWPRGSWER